jgi:hypothetical protein
MIVFSRYLDSFTYRVQYDRVPRCSCSPSPLHTVKAQRSSLSMTTLLSRYLIAALPPHTLYHRKSGTVYVRSYMVRPCCCYRIFFFHERDFTFTKTSVITFASRLPARGRPDKKLDARLVRWSLGRCSGLEGGAISCRGRMLRLVITGRCTICYGNDCRSSGRGGH